MDLVNVGKLLQPTLIADGGGGALLPHIYSPRLARSAPQLSPALQSSLLAALR